MRVLRAAGRTATAWSNGGGVTREIAAAPPGAGWGTFDWRVSLAEVGRDGPYSALPGVDRVLTVAEGAGLELTVDGIRHVLPGPYQPFAFPGDAPTGCRLLGGPVVNFNVMLRRGRSEAMVEMARGRYVAEPRPGDGADASGERRTRLVVALSGRTRLSGPDAACSHLPGSGGSARTLERYDAALMPADAGVSLDTDGVTAVVTLTVRTAAAGARRPEESARHP
ncbi:protein Ves [Streptomyces chrestomyceticus JCM 4735]|uniref:Protein Ves n=1 Tax=Streptomyces chrestomyceticus JCM 4735 TaxID=1306181 RepID=A0A7U9KUL9_9ACTN|nr:HutD family protein [Streptomyces chrestomyceticus]GCD34923.1 protein Ves [Streptomyces chrestomyceticus JCM 4735]